MLVARVYTVLDSAVVEISCVHGSDPVDSHLVIREERRPARGGADGMLVALGEVAELAASLTSAERHRLGVYSACDTA